MARGLQTAGLVAVLCAGCGTASTPVPANTEKETVATPSFPVLAPDTQEDPLAARIDGPQPVPEVELDGLHAAVEQNPADPGARRNLAMGLFRSGYRKEAIEQFEEAARLDPTAARLMDLAHAYGSASRLDDAEAVYDRVLAARPDVPVALYHLANIAFTKAELGRATELYRRAIGHDPNYLLAHYRLGIALKTRRQWVEAYQTFGKVLNLEPGDAEEASAFENALYEIAMLDIQHGELKRAEETLAVLIESNADHAQAHYGYGQLLLRQGRVVEAQRELQTHAQLRSRHKPTGTVATGK
ncbi:MAG: tetratricopeptide repeat protein [Acidobacteria bacterium]|nr:MAG: tetratricopeptide repeat protein [Acidobacteriota bacterium]